MWGTGTAVEASPGACFLGKGTFGRGWSACATAAAGQITLDISLRNAARSIRQKPPTKRRNIHTLPFALASKERASAANHIKRAIFRIISECR